MSSWMRQDVNQEKSDIAKVIKGTIVFAGALLLVLATSPLVHADDLAEGRGRGGKTDLTDSINSRKDISVGKEFTGSKPTPVATNSICEWFGDFQHGTATTIDQLRTKLEKIGFEADLGADSIFTVCVQEGRLFWGPGAVYYVLNFRVESDDKWCEIHEGSYAHHHMSGQVEDFVYKFLVTVMW